MSFEAMRWAVDHDLPAMQKIVLLMMANRVNDKKGCCWPSHELLAKECGMDKRSIIRQIEKLVEAGLIVCIKSKNNKGINNTNKYVLNTSKEGIFKVERDAHKNMKQQEPLAVTERHYISAKESLSSDTESFDLVTESHSNQLEEPINEPIKKTKEPPSFVENKSDEPLPWQLCYEWATQHKFWSYKIASISKFWQLYASPSPNGLKAQYESNLKIEADKEWQTLPVYDDDLVKFAEKHGFTPPKGFDSYQQYRQALKRDIQNRIKSERKMAA